MTMTAAITIPTMPICGALSNSNMPMARSIAAKISIRTSENRFGTAINATPRIKPAAPSAAPKIDETLSCVAITINDVNAMMAPAIIRTMFREPLPPTANMTPIMKMARLAMNLAFHGLPSMTVTLLIRPSLLIHHG